MYGATRQAIALLTGTVIALTPLSAQASQINNEESATPSTACEVVAENDDGVDSRFSGKGICTDPFDAMMTVSKIRGSIEEGSEEYRLSVTEMTGEVTAFIKDHYRVSSVEVNGQRLPLNQTGPYDSRNVYTATFPADQTATVIFRYSTLETWDSHNSALPHGMIAKALKTSDDPSFTVSTRTHIKDARHRVSYDFTVTGTKPHLLIYLPNESFLNSDLEGYDDAYKIDNGDKLFYRVQLDEHGRATLDVTLPQTVNASDAANTLSMRAQRDSANSGITITRTPDINGGELSADYVITGTGITGPLTARLREANREVESLALVHPDGTSIPVTAQDGAYTLPYSGSPITVRVTYTDGKLYSKRELVSDDGLFTALGYFSDDSRILVTRKVTADDDREEAYTYTVTLSDYKRTPEVRLRALTPLISLELVQGNAAFPLESRGDHYVMDYVNDEPLTIEYVARRYCEASLEGAKDFPHVWVDDCLEARVTVEKNTVKDSAGTWDEYTFTSDHPHRQFKVDVSGLKKTRAEHAGVRIDPTVGTTIRESYVMSFDSNGTAPALRILRIPQSDISQASTTASPAGDTKGSAPQVHRRIAKTGAATALMIVSVLALLSVGIAAALTHRRAIG